MSKIVPILWMNTEAEEAAKYYVSIFKNSRIKNISHYTESAAKISGQTKGSVMMVDFELAGREFGALNGGPHFKINPTISFFVNCESIDQINELWQKLSGPGSEIRMKLDKYPFNDHYGWIQDRFGVNWQLYLSKGPQRIAPMLGFAGKTWGQAEAAINFYTSAFADSKVQMLVRYDKNFPGPEGKVVHARFSILGDEVLAMDTHMDMGLDFNAGVSLLIKCRNQDEIDEFWQKLSHDKSAEQCGWLKDRFGISWQIAPESIGRWAQGPQADKVMAAVLKMKKIDMDALKQIATS